MPSRQYGHIKQGRRKDLGDTFFRSAWEANYARYLRFLMHHKLVYKWEHEPDTFWFNEIKRGIRSYLPDFKIWGPDHDGPYYVEVKGYMDSRSKTKLKRMKIYYPEVRVDVVGRREYTAISKRVSGLIRNWE